jgi:replicative superfamily II helicase
VASVLELAQETEQTRWEEDTLEDLGRCYREYRLSLRALTSGAKMTATARRALERRVEFFGGQAERLEKKLDAHIRRIAHYSELVAYLTEKKTYLMRARSVIPSGYDERGAIRELQSGNRGPGG